VDLVRVDEARIGDDVAPLLAYAAAAAEVAGREAEKDVSDDV
jgi:hypothetical protein